MKARHAGYCEKGDLENVMFGRNTLCRFFTNGKNSSATFGLQNAAKQMINRGENSTFLDTKYFSNCGSNKKSPFYRIKVKCTKFCCSVAIVYLPICG